MTTPTGNHILTVYTTNPDGVLDQNTSNDTLNQSIMYFPPVTPPVTESFEGTTFPPEGWDIVNEDGLVTWQKINGYAKTGNNSVYINNFNDHLTGQKDYLRLPTVNISNVDSAFISFQVAAATFSNPSDAGNAWDTSVHSPHAPVHLPALADFATPLPQVDVDFFTGGQHMRFLMHVRYRLVQLRKDRGGAGETTDKQPFQQGRHCAPALGLRHEP